MPSEPKRRRTARPAPTAAPPEPAPTAVRPEARRLLRQARRRYQRQPPADRPADLLGTLTPDEHVALAREGVTLRDAWAADFVTAAQPCSLPTGSQRHRQRRRRLLRDLALLAVRHADDLRQILLAALFAPRES